MCSPATWPLHSSLPMVSCQQRVDGSRKLGPCKQIWLPLSCVWHRRWISVSATTQICEDPRSVWARDAFTSQPLRLMRCLLLGDCVLSVRGVSICRYLPRRGWRRVCECWGRCGVRSVLAASSHDAVNTEAGISETFSLLLGKHFTNCGLTCC